MRHIVLLRGVNVGGNNRLPMAQLREVLAADGFADVRTYVQSGNVVLSADGSPEQVGARCGELIAEHFALAIDVMTRTADELGAIVERNPLHEVADEPKRYQVSFLHEEPDPALVAELKGLAKGGERLEAIGRELYIWHPEGVARSDLWNTIARRRIGTARNWRTVVTLNEMASE